MKRIGRPPADRTGSEFSSNATLTNARDGTHKSNSTRDIMRKGSSDDKPSITDASRGNGQHRSERNEEHSEPSNITTFDGEKNLLMPVGLYLEHAYARSLARFAAKLGLIGWKIAAKQIERVLPPGTKFGPGWVGDSEEHHLSKSKPKLDKLLESSTLKNSPLPTSIYASTATSTNSGKPVNSGAESVTLVKPEGAFGKLQFCKNSTMQHSKNGFKPGYGLNMTRLPEISMTHGHSLNMVYRSGNNDKSLVDGEEAKVWSMEKRKQGRWRRESNVCGRQFKCQQP